MQALEIMQCLAAALASFYNWPPSHAWATAHVPFALKVLEAAGGTSPEPLQATTPARHRLSSQDHVGVFKEMLPRPTHRSLAAALCLESAGRVDPCRFLHELMYVASPGMLFRVTSVEPLSPGFEDVSVRP